MATARAAREATAKKRANIVLTGTVKRICLKSVKKLEACGLDEEMDSGESNALQATLYMMETRKDPAAPPSLRLFRFNNRQAWRGLEHG